MPTRGPDNRLIGLENSIPHGAIETGVTPEPEWTHAQTHENVLAVDAAGRVHWGTEDDVEQVARGFAFRGAEYNRGLDARTIDARALFDGRIPAGWVHTDPIPDAALVYGPNSTYAADVASHQLCTCSINYFLLGTSLYVEQHLLEKVS